MLLRSPFGKQKKIGISSPDFPATRASRLISFSGGPAVLLLLGGVAWIWRWSAGWYYCCCTAVVTVPGAAARAARSSGRVWPVVFSILLIASACRNIVLRTNTTNIPTMFVHPRSEVRLGPSPRAGSGGPPQVKLEESEPGSNSNSDPSPLELDLAVALTPPPAVRRQTAGRGRRSSTAGRGSSRSRIRAPGRGRRSSSAQRESSRSRIRAPSPVSVDDPRVLLPPRQQQQQQQQTRANNDPSMRNRRTRRSASSTASTVHRSQRELQQALLRGDVPMGFGADASEIRRQQRQRGADAIRYVQNWADIVGAEY